MDDKKTYRVNPTGNTFWDILLRIINKLTSKSIFYISLVILSLIFGLTILGYLRFKYFDGKFNVELGNKPNSDEIIDQNIAGKWKAVIYDQQFDEFKKKYRHNVDFNFNISGSGELLLVKGHLKTYDSTGVFIGEAEVIGQGRMERSEFARISYSLINETVRGFGVILINIDPSGKHGSGFALYRRTRSQNGRFGLGKIEMNRVDHE